jgi:Putative beta-barrel porin-2, OmpL-like. bbp2
MRRSFRNAGMQVIRFLILASLAAATANYAAAQASGSAAPQPPMIAHSEPPAAPPAGPAAAADTHATPAAAAAPQPAPEMTPEMTIDQEIAALKSRLEQLEQRVKDQHAATQSSNDAAALNKAEHDLVGVNQPPALRTTASIASAMPGSPQTTNPQAMSQPAAPAAKDPHAAPFSDYDWTWLNGNPRNKDTAFDSKFFTPEIRSDITYTYDFNKPEDDTMSGSSELFRTNEIELEQFGLGGDFHLDNAHARFMTQFGLYSTATIRNDPSYSKGQWDIADADRYLSEAYGGYQLPNIMHGINIDAGIFMSYVGLFSYYNFDNWAYQPSYVSSNTPWFFQGIRIQIFPTEHLKIEPWFINGWQSYGSSNTRKGLGGQIKWTPNSWINIISNEYGMGSDDFEVTGRDRMHTDNSLEVKYFDKPTSYGLDKLAFSLTGDIGCEYGAGVNCHNDHGGQPKQSFTGYMLYNRAWFHKDLYGLTIGGGQIDNPGMYLVLVPPINGETATSAALDSPYFQMNSGDAFKGWDSTVTFDYMPREWFTWRWEYGIRGTNIPYWSGHGGMTPPAFAGAPWGVNNGAPTQFACMDGSAVPNPNNAPYSSGQVPYGTTETGAPGFATAYCNGSSSSTSHGGVWYPDLRRDEQYVDIDLLVKF